VQGKKIISVSRRTDIPAFYDDWFFEHLQKGFVNVKNPFNPHQIRKVSLKKEDVLCFVFWTKNPLPMLPKLNLLKDFPFYFLFTLNPYGRDVEIYVPDKTELIETFRKLSEQIGKKRVIWRYDPILLSEKYNLAFHFERFEFLAEKLHNYTEKCIISFIDFYRKTKRKTAHLHLREISEKDKKMIVKNFSETAKKFNIKIQTCAEKTDFSEFGISHGKCIDDELISEIIGREIHIPKDKNQRKECNCVSSIDIGTYDTCHHHCLYCYANG